MVVIFNTKINLLREVFFFNRQSLAPFALCFKGAVTQEGCNSGGLKLGLAETQIG